MSDANSSSVNTSDKANTSVCSGVRCPVRLNPADECFADMRRRILSHVANNNARAGAAFFKVTDDGLRDLLKVGFQSSRTALDQ